MTATQATETMTTRDIARAIGVAPRTVRFEVTNRDGFTEIDSMWLPRWEKILVSLSRTDISDVSQRVHTVAYALHKSISSARMSPVDAMRIQAYTPYRLCALVSRIARECPETTIGGICDVWIQGNHESL